VGSKRKKQHFSWRRAYTVNKGLGISRPQPGCHLPNFPWPGIIDPIPVPGRFGKKIQESKIFYSVVVTDIPARISLSFVFS